jgi:hypothetical protein
MSRTKHRNPASPYTIVAIETIGATERNLARSAPLRGFEAFEPDVFGSGTNDQAAPASRQSCAIASTCADFV